MTPPSHDDRRISWNGANWQFFYQGKPGMIFFAEKNALRWAGVNFGTNHDEDWYNIHHRINPFRVDL